MAKRRENKVTEEKLQILIGNWSSKEIGEIASMLEADEASVAYWAAQLRKSMKKQGVKKETVNKLLPSKRKVRPNVYDVVVSKLISGQPAKKKRAKRAKKGKE